MNIPTPVIQKYAKVGLSDFMDNYFIQNLNEMKVNYEEKDILAVFQKKTLNILKIYN